MASSQGSLVLSGGNEYEVWEIWARVTDSVNADAMFICNNWDESYWVNVIKDPGYIFYLHRPRGFSYLSGQC